MSMFRCAQCEPYSATPLSLRLACVSVSVGSADATGMCRYSDSRYQVSVPDPAARYARGTGAREKLERRRTDSAQRSLAVQNVQNRFRPGQKVARGALGGSSTCPLAQIQTSVSLRAGRTRRFGGRRGGARGRRVCHRRYVCPNTSTAHPHGPEPVARVCASARVASSENLHECTRACLPAARAACRARPDSSPQPQADIGGPREIKISYTRISPVDVHHPLPKQRPAAPPALVTTPAVPPHPRARHRCRSFLGANRRGVVPAGDLP